MPIVSQRERDVSSGGTAVITDTKVALLLSVIVVVVVVVRVVEVEAVVHR